MPVQTEKTAGNGVREVAVGPEEAGQRIDNFLMRHLKGVPKSRIYRILRKGEVRVNKGRVKPEYRVAAGDRVRIPPVRTSERGKARPGDKVLDRVAAAVLFEDKRFVVVNKPGGLAVHGGSGLSYGLIEALRALRPEAPFLELGHRLDRETSGCLVVAKRRSALRSFHEQLRNGGVDKQYLALVQGQWQGGKRRIEAPLRKNVLQSGERLVRVDPAGKPALSIVEPVSIFRTCSLVRVHLMTGRTHQARVHLAHAGHPIAGDDKYGDTAFNRTMAAAGLRRLFLHAASVSFRAGEDQAEIDVNAPLPPELRTVLEQQES